MSLDPSEEILYNPHAALLNAQPDASYNTSDNIDVDKFLADLGYHDTTFDGHGIDFDPAQPVDPALSMSVALGVDGSP
ncbi:hypothetical protein N0V83_000059 [Neocucurbitaria cava]|uniref:Uncharacterized protein n=1 Tax=Neocucurbitaria cava TaxID=798079 RepID=A0A9W8YGD1_9PLEO|nr:hypothetical protein N0V83_000059 [Neocucurbitaria cava]